MPKRKFESDQDVDFNHCDSTDRIVRKQQEKLKRTLEHSEKLLFGSFKLARGFERQKLGRRQKTAKENEADEETARLNAEVAALKVSFVGGFIREEC